MTEPVNSLPQMTDAESEPRWFSRPNGDFVGTLNPVFDLLDFPIATGGADDIVLRGPAPRKPLVGGREVSDPRLFKALSTPVELSRAEVLDRSAKLAGVLRVMGIGNTPDDWRLTIADDVSPIPRALVILAAVRIGLPVDLSAVSGASDFAVADSANPTVSGADSPRAADVESDHSATVDSPIRIVHIVSIPAEPAAPGRASVKVVRSRFEGVGVTIGGEAANLDHAMRDSRVESAAVVPLDPERLLIVRERGGISARESLAWLRSEVLEPA